MTDYASAATMSQLVHALEQWLEELDFWQVLLCASARG